jgi:hypothetical protein
LAGCCECGDEPSGCGATELVIYGYKVFVEGTLSASYWRFRNSFFLLLVGVLGQDRPVAKSLPTKDSTTQSPMRWPRDQRPRLDRGFESRLAHGSLSLVTYADVYLSSFY